MPRRKPKAPVTSTVISPERGVDNLRTSTRHIKLPDAVGPSSLRRHYGSPQPASLFHAAARIPSDLDEKTYFELHGIASPTTELRDRPGRDVAPNSPQLEQPRHGPAPRTQPACIIDLTLSQEPALPGEEPTSEPSSPGGSIDEPEIMPDIHLGHQHVPDSCPASPILSNQIPDSEPGWY